MNYSAKLVAELRTLARGKLRRLNVKRNSAKRHLEEEDEWGDIVCPGGEKWILHAVSVLPLAAGVMKLKYATNEDILGTGWHNCKVCNFVILPDK